MVPIRCPKCDIALAAVPVRNSWGTIAGRTCRKCRTEWCFKVSRDTTVEVRPEAKHSQDKRQDFKPWDVARGEYAAKTAENKDGGDRKTQNAT